ncbi:uncharacterized protein BDW70DRAFT_131837 [Aspergillus foveolatus]|uniref:uncharacterized protein n=1 Tax=Aspergillus foveolatus TaxID=210207 RepID=UPI003CCE3C6F
MQHPLYSTPPTHDQLYFQIPKQCFPHPRLRAQNHPRNLNQNPRFPPAHLLGNTPARHLLQPHSRQAYTRKQHTTPAPSLFARHHSNPSIHNPQPRTQPLSYSSKQAA